MKLDLNVPYSFWVAVPHWLQAKLDNLGLLKAKISDDPLAILPSEAELGVHKCDPKKIDVTCTYAVISRKYNS